MTMCAPGGFVGEVTEFDARVVHLDGEAVVTHTLRAVGVDQALDLDDA
jgi:hypothetical protein